MDQSPECPCYCNSNSNSNSSKKQTKKKKINKNKTTTTGIITIKQEIRNKKQGKITIIFACKNTYTHTPRFKKENTFRFLMSMYACLYIRMPINMCLSVCSYDNLMMIIMIRNE